MRGNAGEWRSPSVFRGERRSPSSGGPDGWDLQKMEDWQYIVQRQRCWHARVLDTISADWKDKYLFVVDCLQQKTWL